MFVPVLQSAFFRLFALVSCFFLRIPTEKISHFVEIIYCIQIQLGVVDDDHTLR